MDSYSAHHRVIKTCPGRLQCYTVTSKQVANIYVLARGSVIIITQTRWPRQPISVRGSQTVSYTRSHLINCSWRRSLFTKQLTAEVHSGTISNLSWIPGEEQPRKLF